jgi:spore maturation protein CgeB
MTWRIVIIGLSITSAWGNGHATTYRGLVKALTERGHDVLFLERDVPWYAQNRDLASPPFGTTCLYSSLEELEDGFSGPAAEADLVLVGSYVPDGVAVVDWVLRAARGIVGFYDIDTPVTLAKLGGGAEEYVAARQVPFFDLYLSFSGGPALRRLESEYGARRARPLYCSVDPDVYAPLDVEERWLLGYLGTYSEDRQRTLDAMLVEPARQLPDRRFAVAGAQYPPGLGWPANVDRIAHLSPGEHRSFYASERFTLNVTRREMIRAGWSPSVRLFEAAACGVPVISDWWPGLDSFFQPEREILVAGSGAEMVRLLRRLPVEEARRIGIAARRRVLDEHTAGHRAVEVERFMEEAWQARAA